MASWQQRVDEWFSTHHGIAGAAQLELLGMSTSTMHRWAAQGRLIRVLPGVFRSAQWPDGPMQTAAAACARNATLMIAFTSACSMWHFRKVDDRGLHTLVPHGVTPEIDGLVVHRCRRIDAVDVVERADGIRLTSPPRSLFDSADMLGLSVARSVMEQILHEELCTLGTITDTFTRLAHPNRPGTRTMAEVIASRPAWRRALQSDLEQRVLVEIERQQLPAPVTQCAVDLPTGQRIHLDFGWPEWRVGLEVDHPAWHAGFEDRHRDMRRDRKSAVVGWSVSRVSTLDVDTALREAVADVAEIIRVRSRAA